MIIREPNVTHKNNIGRVDFHENDFDKAIIQHGAKVLWQKSILCPCLDEHTGQPDFMCSMCKGKGYVYDKGTIIKALAYSQNGNKEQIPIGLLDLGTCLMTTRACDRVGFRDRITFLDYSTPFSDVVTFTEQFGTKEGLYVEQLKYNCLELTQVMVKSASADGLHDALIDVTEECIIDDEDPSKILFSENLGLSYGDRFSIRMLIRPTYIVIDMPHELRGQYIKFGKPIDTFTELPKQFMIKREDLLPLSRGELL